VSPSGRLFVAELRFAGCSMPSYDRALHALRTWLDSWAGIGHVAVGMARQGYDLQLTRYGRSRLAGHVLHDGDGALADERDRHRVGSARSWHATQRAAWEALAPFAFSGTADREEGSRRTRAKGRNIATS
jgi:hypothetical protein